MGWPWVAKSAGRKKKHLLDGFWWGGNPLEDVFGIQVWEIIRNKNTQKVNQISPHSGDVFMTVNERPFWELASCIPEGRSKDRERGGKEREKEEKDYPCAYIYRIYIYLYTSTFKDDIRYPLFISIYQVSWEMGQLMVCCLPRLQPFCCHWARYGLGTLTHFSMSTCLVSVMFHFWVWDWFCENLFITD